MQTTTDLMLSNHVPPSDKHGLTYHRLSLASMQKFVAVVEVVLGMLSDYACPSYNHGKQVSQILPYLNVEDCKRLLQLLGVLFDYICPSDKHERKSHKFVPYLYVKESRWLLQALGLHVGVCLALDDVSEGCQLLAAQHSYIHQLPARPAITSIMLLIDGTS